MTSPTVFISYSHADEWLKDELITHLSALKRNGMINVWHDRLIPPGGMLNESIDAQVNSADVFLFLISPSFLSSDYCFHKEYEIAKGRHKSGEAEIVPVVIRECDWDVGGLRDYRGLPRDGVAVTKNAGSRTDAQQRDGAWLNVVEGLKEVISNVKKKLEPPSLSENYKEKLFKVDFIRHPMLVDFDERLIFVDPDIYYENEKEQLTSFEQFAQVVLNSQISIVTGGDRSGKSLLAKKTQTFLDSSQQPSVLIKGRSIRNADIDKLIKSTIDAQYQKNEYSASKYSVVIDDFDECTLTDRIKEQIVIRLTNNYKRVVLLSFTSATSVLFASDDLPDPHILNINQLANDKIYSIVTKWKAIGTQSGIIIEDKEVLIAYEKLQLIFDQSEIEKSAYSSVTFLELMESAAGGDIAISSFASCYDTLVTNRLQRAGIDWKTFDEAKNFLANLAYRAFVDSESKVVTAEIFESVLSTFEEKYLSSKSALRKMALSSFLMQDDDGYYEFREEYLWFFLCARYVAKELSRENKDDYVKFVSRCTKNIFHKKFANIAIFIAYFSGDDLVITCLIDTLKGLFSKAETWQLTDEVRDLMLGIVSDERLIIYVGADVTENRIQILKEKISDIIGDAMKVVAQYTLPFLSSNIADSEFVEEINEREIDADSYMRSVNALLRTHSVLGQILATRAGTFSASVLLNCITNMVQASGRYAALNHAIATILIHEDEETVRDVQNAISGDHSIDDKLRKVRRIFAFWSVYLSQAGLARYLSNDHAIRALERLVEDYESGGSSDREVPFNFTSVLVIARLYSTGRINRTDIDNCIKKYGENSAILHLLRVAIHIYTYYMPLEIEEKQWLSAKLSIPVRRIETQRFRASDVGRAIIRSTRTVLPDPKRD
ncbi:TIR domain-containing protein [Mesorhizobium sp. ESP-6-2]|uniref:TIR domain-containing protein n=1 Tax=Mesorhizobium sp. ESP-6-2 TaxID=2876625 RepID=UPI001CCFE971|nr:toll/interleukin-1 receptor domain-containing protein [Mesorhizobium sp. ESP-6-2]MBZ9808319.1 toll/interleukin-1 receptor domain-containing protein [Mesorhizobium sp. ESP-6-2]